MAARIPSRAFAIGRQQIFHFAEHFSVAGAGLAQEAGASLRRQIGCGIKQVFSLLPAFHGPGRKAKSRSLFSARIRAWRIISITGRPAGGQVTAKDCRKHQARRPKKAPRQALRPSRDREGAVKKSPQAGEADETVCPTFENKVPVLVAQAVSPADSDCFTASELRERLPRTLREILKAHMIRNAP